MVTSEVLGVGRHPDLPPMFVHFTGRPRAADDEPPPYADGDAEARLVRVLGEGRLRAASSYGSPPVVCVSEATDAALTAMLKDGVSDRGQYPPWGVLLSRTASVEHGARPAIHASHREQLRWRIGKNLKAEDELTEGRFVSYAPPGIDWTHEREWRFCFGRGEAEPEVKLDGLVVGVITGRRDWYPPPLTARFGASGTRRKYAGCCQNLPRFVWTNDELVPDGRFDIRSQMLLGP